MTPTQRKKIFTVGDLMVTNLHGWMMSRTKTVKVHSFSGSTVQDMEYFVEPILARYPDHIIIHVGTNSLSDKSMTADRTADNIFQLANKIKKMLFHFIDAEDKETILETQTVTY